MGVILDSSVVISGERSGMPARELVALAANKTGDDVSALSSIGLTELIHGVHRANSEQRKASRHAYLEDILLGVEVYPFTEAAARLAGRIDGEQTAIGNTIPFPDLLIAATALSLNFSVLTTNLRHFRQVPGLNVIPF